MHSLAKKCMQLKPSTNSSGLMEIFLGILRESTEVDMLLAIFISIVELYPCINVCTRKTLLLYMILFSPPFFRLF